MRVQRLLSFVDRIPRRQAALAAALAVLVIGVVDYATGFEISLSFFYLIPISLVAWSAGRRAGILFSVVCAVTWLLANELAGEHLSHPLIPYWNALARAGFFFVVTLLLVELRRALEHERQLARTDFLTGLLNRRAFHDAIDAEVLRATRYGHPLALVYVDADRFKAVNDALGHEAGDALLQQIAVALRRETRANDVTARLGGDEFAVLLPETTGVAAGAIAERLRSALRGELTGGARPVTFSIGVLACGPPPPRAAEILAGADRLMYLAKEAGGDRVAAEGTAASPGPVPPLTGEGRAAS